MFAQIPFEIVGYVIEYLDFENVRSIARVCSTFRRPAQLRLFRTVRIVTDTRITASPDRVKSILSSPHLLGCISRFVVKNPGSLGKIITDSLWEHLPTMYRLKNVEICLKPDYCSKALVALESLGSAREIALDFEHDRDPDVLITDKPLPVHNLVLSPFCSSYPVGPRLVQKCSQSLRQLRLLLVDNSPPPLPFMPRLDELSLDMQSLYNDKELDLMTWFPFLHRHPTITRISLCHVFTLTVQAPPDLLPNLQFLKAIPPIIERLTPGRPVTDISTLAYSQPDCPFPLHGLLRPLRQPFVPVTAFELSEFNFLPNDLLVDIVQALPNLRNCSLTWKCQESGTALQDVLTALGRCKDMVDIRLYPTYSYISPYRANSLWSRGDFVQMVQRVQENGAAGLWRFELRAITSGLEGCEAVRVGWLDVPRQPTLQGEWRFIMWGVY